jgi:RNA recognition motif-containing protein
MTSLPTKPFATTTSPFAFGAPPPVAVPAPGTPITPLSPHQAPNQHHRPQPDSLALSPHHAYLALRGSDFEPLSLPMSRKSSFTASASRNSSLTAGIPSACLSPNNDAATEWGPPTGLSLFVTRLHASTEWHHLFDLFKHIDDKVEIRILNDKATKRSRGFGYVNFATPEKAVQALREMNRKPGPFGTPLNLELAKNDTQFTAEETSKLFLRQVPVDTSDAVLRELFEPYGAIADITVHPHDLSCNTARAPSATTMAYVTFGSFREASAAMKALHRKVTLPAAQQPLDVRYAESLGARGQRIARDAKGAAEALMASAMTQPPTALRLQSPQQHQQYQQLPMVQHFVAPPAPLLSDSAPTSAWPPQHNPSGYVASAPPGAAAMSMQLAPAFYSVSGGFVPAVSPPQPVVPPMMDTPWACAPMMAPTPLQMTYPAPQHFAPGVPQQPLHYGPPMPQFC